jgi:hypothetical protein
MLVFNPKNGATIRDMWVYDKLYFSVKLEEEFKPGDVIDIEDKVGKFLLETLGFLEEVSAIRAQNIIKERGVEKFACDHEGCTFEAKSPIGLVAHKRIHESVVEGVRKIAPAEPEERKVPKEDSAQKSIEAESKGSGLLGGDMVVS